MPLLPVDLSALSLADRQAIADVCKGQYDQQLTAAIERQKQLIAAHRRRPPRGMPELGDLQKMAVIDQGLLNYFRAKYGSEVVDGDPDFIPWLLSQGDHSDSRVPFRVRAIGSKCQVGWRAPERRVKFSKTYA